MKSNDLFTEIIRGLKDVTEKPHFERSGFSVGKKLFATVDAKHTLACVKLSPESQHQFHKIDKAVYPVPNSWGKKGWTNLDLLKIPESLLAEVIETAYYESKNTSSC